MANDNVDVGVDNQEDEVGGQVVVTAVATVFGESNVQPALVALDVPLPESEINE